MLSGTLLGFVTRSEWEGTSSSNWHRALLTRITVPRFFQTGRSCVIKGFVSPSGREGISSILSHRDLQAVPDTGRSHCVESSEPLERCPYST
jgi:hypothetical protein